MTIKETSPMPYRALVAVAALAATAVLAVAAAPAQAEFGLVPGSFSARTHDAAGNDVTQAGSHADSTVAFTLNTKVDDRGRTVPDESLKDVSVELPRGFVGNPQATPRCSHQLFFNSRCPRLSMVGVETLTISFSPGFPGAPWSVPVYNLEPAEGEVALFGFAVQNSTVTIHVRVRSDGRYNLVTDIRDVSELLIVYGSSLTLWGVPADNNGEGPNAFTSGLSYGGPSGAPRVPFLTIPTECGPPEPSTIRVRSWQHADRWAQPVSYAMTSGATGCEQLDFRPSIEVTPTSTRADAPSGYAVELRVPQSADADGLATPTLRDAVVTLPEGVSLSPAAATGLVGCPDERLGLGSAAPASCPDASRIGTVVVDSPVLPEQLQGSIVLRPQRSGDPASGEMFRIALALRGRLTGLVIKLPGQVRLNPASGRVETTFADNPQLPFSAMTLRFFGGSRAPLVNPPTCGPKTVEAAFVSWSGARVSVGDSFSIDCPGLAGFAPAFGAGSTNARAGAFSRFALRVDRADGQQYIDGLSLELPRGLLAKIKDMPLCADAQAVAGTCGAQSRVGTATVASGAGASPYFLRGAVSLGGPYKGAPYSLSVAVPAVAGPFDLGMVVVRQAIFIDPIDAHLTVGSDPLPTIVKGVPLRLRSLAVDIDRPGFMVNPTSCAEQRVGGSLHAADGSVAPVAARFQVGECRALRLTPKLRLSLRGRKPRDGQHPGVGAVVTQRAGQSNMRSVAVKLPKSLALDPDNANALCEFEAGLRVDCPKESIVGRATAVSPLLNRPLTGPVYFVKGVRTSRTGRRIRTLPTLLLPLRGEIALDVRARTSVSRGRLVTTFPAIPDAPLSRFELRLSGGRSGILVANRSVCGARRGTRVGIKGHNGKRSSKTTKLRVRCGKKKKGK